MKSSKGFTLLELLIVLVIVGVMATIGGGVISNSYKSKAREISWRMASTVKYLYDTAAAKGQTVRLVIDFDSNSYWAEASVDKVLLAKETADEKKKREEEKLASEREKAAKTEAEKEEEESAKSDEPTTIEPYEATFGVVEMPLFDQKQLPNGIFFKDVYTTHDAEPVTGGRAFVYFFPSGYAEEAVINFRDEGDKRNLSVRITQLGGKVKIEQEYQRMENEKR